MDGCEAAFASFVPFCGSPSKLPFCFAVFHHRLQHALALERAAQPTNEFGGDGFEEDTFRRGFHVGARALLNLKFLSQSPGNDRLWPWIEK